MNPETGERLGFGITMILAMLALDITASEMMPVTDWQLTSIRVVWKSAVIICAFVFGCVCQVCNEKTFMDYLSQVSRVEGLHCSHF